MNPGQHDRSWDLTPIIHLIHALSPCNGKNPSRRRTQPDTRITITDDTLTPASTLGDFERLWKELGIAPDIPAPHIEPSSTPAGKNELKLQTPSNGHHPTPSKGVRWRDEDGVAELADNVAVEGERVQREDFSKLSKSERKKRRMAEEMPAAKKAMSTHGPLGSDFESEMGIHGLQTSLHRMQTRSMRVASPKATVQLSDDTAITSTSPPKPSILKAYVQLPLLRPPFWTPPPYRIEPLIKLTAPERKAKLVIKLMESFPNESDSLLQLAGSALQSRATSTRSTSKDVHVFVDCSNIMIGFFDCLKRTRNIPSYARTRRVPMSFHSFALVLERGRHAQKRVLVGSKPLTPSVSEAEACGYELSILDRVMKAREQSSRVKGNHQHATGGNTTSGHSSGSETTAPPRLVEQAVDEILHLKMLESMIDVRDPGIMVLATGDAAEAEYSGGFMRMVERALEKGWKVELASFKANLSGAYRQKYFRNKWLENFKLIFLDDFSEELLDL